MTDLHLDRREFLKGCCATAAIGAGVAAPSLASVSQSSTFQVIA